MVEILCCCYLLRDVSVYESGGSISFADGVGAGVNHYLMMIPHPTPLIPVQLCLYIYLFHANGGTTALKPLDSKFTLVIKGRGKE